MLPTCQYWRGPLPILFSLPVNLKTISAALRRSGLVALLCSITSAAMLFADRPACAQSAAARAWGDDLAVDPFAPFVIKAAQRFAIPAPWIHAVIHAESGGDAHALSSKGAMGLMQIMPETWSELRTRYNLGADPYDCRDNILAGVAYLRELFDRYGAAGFLAAYNAGPARYEDHLATGRALPEETRAYVAMLAPTIAGARSSWWCFQCSGWRWCRGLCDSHGSKTSVLRSRGQSWGGSGEADSPFCKLRIRMTRSRKWDHNKDKRRFPAGMPREIRR